MSELEIRAISPEEFEAFARTGERSFGAEPNAEELERWREAIELDRTLAAFDGPRIVGTAAAFSYEVTVPGATVPMAGVTAVGVLPTHRRRGVLTAMMRKQLDDVRDRGEPLAGLWASESSIYGRFGYGSSAPTADVAIERRRATLRVAPTDGGSIRPVEREEALDLLPPIYERFRPRMPGAYTYDRPRWRALLSDTPERREGFGPLFVVVHESEGSADGYVTHRMKHEWPHGSPAGTLRVVDLLAVTDEAYAALWKYCFGVDLIGTIEAPHRPVDEPLRHMLLEPRQLRQNLGDGLWLRLLDVPIALAARRYSTQGRLVLDVRDSFCPSVGGCFELEGGPDGAECRPSSRRADVTLESAELAAAYLGGTRFTSLARAGLVHGDRDALRAADLMFSWDPLPWCPTIF